MELKWYKAIIIIFTMSGISISTWFSRTPEVRDLLQANTGTMGLILLGLSVGSIVGLVLSNIFVRKRRTSGHCDQRFFDVHWIHDSRYWFNTLFYPCCHSRSFSFWSGLRHVQCGHELRRDRN